MNPSSITQRVLAAKALRGFGDGFVSLLLPLYLLDLGFTPLEVGVVATATLFGSGLLTLAIGFTGGRFSDRSLLLAASALMLATGLGLGGVTTFWPLLVVAFVGTLNPSGGDVSVFLPLEHALLSRSVANRDRTAMFARYALAGTLSGAVGALAAGAAGAAAMRWMFVMYAVIAVAAALLYRGLPAQPASHEAAPPSALGPSRRRVYTLAALFSLDAFGGGFIVQSLLALWLFQRFGLSVETAGAIFFCNGVLAAFSYLLAARIAMRIGLVKTMVYTHVPANMCLIAMAFTDALAVVLALMLVRALLSQMDVPTRSSYVMAIVTPEERAAAASVTAVPRSLASAASPALAGWMLGLSSFGWPLVAGGVLKIGYDLLLLAMFHRVKPPEEG
ncbi:MAG: MFS transporter [Burkholderiales bacterium]|nr:MFS transporter [Burkholderiales bacterium]